jgi:hypothetical protein
MRDVIKNGGFPASSMLYAFLLNILFLAAAMWLLNTMLTSARKKGFLVKVTSS